VPTLRAGTLAHPTYATADRPSATDAGAGGTVYDVTLRKLITSNGTDWFDQSGAAV
jgi:hypothetical protein